MLERLGQQSQPLRFRYDGGDEVMR